MAGQADDNPPSDEYSPSWTLPCSTRSKVFRAHGARILRGAATSSRPSARLSGQTGADDRIGSRAVLQTQLLPPQIRVCCCPDSRHDSDGPGTVTLFPLTDPCTATKSWVSGRHIHSITSSATAGQRRRASSPSAFAVLRRGQIEAWLRAAGGGLDTRGAHISRPYLRSRVDRQLHMRGRCPVSPPNPLHAGVTSSRLSGMFVGMTRSNRKPASLMIASNSLAVRSRPPAVHSIIVRSSMAWLCAIGPA